MQCSAVRVGIDSYRRYAELAAGAMDAQGDFTAIGDENPSEGR
jgi:hypothetical protein